MVATRQLSAHSAVLSCPRRFGRLVWVSCEVTFYVDEDMAEQLVQSIEDSVESDDGEWVFQCEFSTLEALRLRHDIKIQLEE